MTARGAKGEKPPKKRAAPPRAAAAGDDAGPAGPRLRRTVPLLPVLDIGRAVEFYAARLGFAPGFRFDDYASVARDDVEIHLWLCRDPSLPKSSGCRIELDRVEPLFAEMSAQGVIHPEGALADKPWHFREFAVLDLDGNVLTFAQDLATGNGER
jgi:catechol 2,3-dioxygenase-like lactoylglutathione lyase family enzyme